MASYIYTPAGYSRQGGSTSISGSSSRSFDYTGMDDHVQRQDAVASARDAKKSALYGGDPVQAMLAGNKVRELLSILRRDTPGATEQNPHVIKRPLVRVSSMSDSYSQSTNPGGSEYKPGAEKYETAKPESPPPAKPATAAPPPKPVVPTSAMQPFQNNPVLQNRQALNATLGPAEPAAASPPPKRTAAPDAKPEEPPGKPAAGPTPHVRTSARRYTDRLREQMYS